MEDPSGRHDKFMSFSDTVSLIGLAAAILFWVFAPTFMEKGTAVIVVALILAWTVYNGHYARRLKRRIRQAFAAGLTLLLLLVFGCQLRDQWKGEHETKTSGITEQSHIVTAVVSPQRPATLAPSNQPQVKVPRAPLALTSDKGQVESSCHIPENRSPCEMICSASNPNDKEAVRDVTIGFRRDLPHLTRIAASPEDRVTLVPSDTLAAPSPNGEFVDTQAFTIVIPLIPPSKSVQFTLWSNDRNNKKACTQLQVIQLHRRSVLSDFFKAVSKRQPSVKIPDLDQLLLMKAKDDNLFHPDMVESERGERKVVFYTDQEQDLQKVENEIYKLKPQYAEVFAKDKYECMSPIITVDQTGGNLITTAVFPDSVRTYVDMTMDSSAKPASDGKLTIPPVPPDHYECTLNE